MFAIVKRIAHGRAYWSALILLGLALLGVALWYQYVRQELPCTLCIHVRLLVAAMLLMAVLGLALRRWRWPLVGIHAINTAIMAAQVERAWVLLGTERGTLMASCDFNVGLPPWLALDQWLPALFQAQTSCGYTPQLLFGVTMAEGLMAIFAVLLAVSAVLTLAAAFRD